MLGYVEIVLIYLTKFNILYQGEACKDKTLRSVSLRRVRLSAVMVFGIVTYFANTNTNTKTNLSAKPF